jgi:glycosyltransferase involved in cell wall biosynthesis
MSLGKPVLATKVGGIEQTIVDGESGLLVAPGDPNALQAALDKLLGDPAFCRSLGENARARYEAKFTLEAMVRNHEQLYEERLGRS